MGLRFASLGSGSKGNATVVGTESACVLIDCGFSVRETERRLGALGLHASDLTAVLVTHEHGDHIRGVGALVRKYGLPVYMTPGTALSAPARALAPELITPQKPFQVGPLRVLPVVVPHDAREPVQYVIEHGSRRLGILTDLGSVTANVVKHFDNCDGLLLEANHDSGMLASGVYPPSLKRRVGGDWGHLNNTQTADLLSVIERRKIQSLVLGHISMQNNRPDLVAQAVAPYVSDVGNLLYACQDKGFSWQVVE